MPCQLQIAELKSEYSDLTKPKPKQKQRDLPELKDAKEGGVVTRFPPEPSGYPHIGHAKAAIINEQYVKMYGGKKILRMDDTNPESERLEFYAAIKVGLEWLGIEYDIVKNTSDDIDMLLRKGAALANSGDIYVCTCKRNQVQENRAAKKECKCRKLEISDSMERWDKMFEKYKPGQAVARLRGDMSSDNTVMRDPVMFRIIEGKHPLLGTKYPVWPSYDFAISIEDSVDGVTHAFRSKEYEMRAQLYYDILDRLSMRKPQVLVFSRLALEGMPVSKRLIKPLIEEGKVSGYDDPRLPTIEALKRRGITSDAVRKFVISLGMTKSDTMAPFDSLVAFNRQIIDPSCVRLFMVKDPVKCSISGPLPSEIKIAILISKDGSGPDIEHFTGSFTMKSRTHDGSIICLLNATSECKRCALVLDSHVNIIRGILYYIVFYAKPFKHLYCCIKFKSLTFWICIIHAEYLYTAVHLYVLFVYDCSLCVPYMRITARFWRKSSYHASFFGIFELMRTITLPLWILAKSWFCQDWIF